MELDELIGQAIEDPSKEEAIFRRLLDSEVYIHAPKISRGTNLSVVQFKTPQGFLAIPVFTDKEKADVAGRGNVRVVRVGGRKLLLATLGAVSSTRRRNCFAQLVGWRSETQGLTGSFVETLGDLA